MARKKATLPISEEFKNRGINAPKFLSFVGQYQYRKIILALQQKGIFDQLDVGVVEQAALCYQMARDEELDSRERRQWSLQYVDFMQRLGATPKGRYQIKLANAMQIVEDPEADLKEVFGG